MAQTAKQNRQVEKPKGAPQRAFASDPARKPVDFSKVIQPTVQFELYNPGDEAVEQAVDGNPYTVPANTEYAYILTRGGTAYRYSKPGVLPIMGTGILPARTIVEFLVGPDGRSGKIGPRGVRLLLPGEEEAVREEAYIAWVDSKRQDSLNLTRAHEDAVARATAMKENPPRPSRKVMKAYSWLAENDAAASLRFACPVCNWGMKYEQELHVHVVTHHRAHPIAKASREYLEANAEVEDEETDGGVLRGQVLDLDDTELEQEKRTQLPIPSGLTNAGETLNRAAAGEEVTAPRSNRAGTKIVGGPEPKLEPTAAPVTHKGAQG